LWGSESRPPAAAAAARPRTERLVSLFMSSPLVTPSGALFQRALKLR
jgi:hypothetical protein